MSLLSGDVVASTLDAAASASAAEVRQCQRDLLEFTEAPVATFTVLDSTPDSGLVSLREQVKRAARSSDWNAVLGKATAEA